LSEISFKLVTFSKSYGRKHKWLFFSEPYSVYPRMFECTIVYALTLV